MDVAKLIETVNKEMGLNLTPVLNERKMYASSWQGRFYYEKVLEIPLTQIISEDQVNALSGLLPKRNNDPTTRWAELDSNDRWVLARWADLTAPENNPALMKLKKVEHFSKCAGRVADLRNVLTCNKCNISNIEMRFGAHATFYQATRPFIEKEYATSLCERPDLLVNSMKSCIRNLQELSELLLPEWQKANDWYDGMNARLPVIKKRFSIIKESR